MYIMDALDNKRMLWDTLVEQQWFKEEVSVEKSQALFETLLKEINPMEVDLNEKNRLFLEQWQKQLDTAALVARSSWLEERMNKKQFKVPPTAGELAEIKQLLYRILEILE